MYYQGMTLRYLPGLFILERALRASQQFTVNLIELKISKKNLPQCIQIYLLLPGISHIQDLLSDFSFILHFGHSDFEFITSTQTPGWQSNAYGVIRTSRAGGLTGLIILAGWLNYYEYSTVPSAYQHTRAPRPSQRALRAVGLQ